MPNGSRPLLLLLLLAAGVLVARPAQAQTCSKFRTCAEAMKSLQEGNSRLDSDGDGLPCESLCKGYQPSAPPRQKRSNNSRPLPVVPARQTPAAPRPRPSASSLSGPVQLVSVGDGDTIRVKGPGGQPVTVRLACIDAPETAQGALGYQATATLRQLVSTGPLQLKPQTTDRYGRTVAEVIAGGRNVNLELVRTGAVFVYYRYLSACDRAAYVAAEEQAQRFRQGVWKWDGSVERPWDFRSRRRNR